MKKYEKSIVADLRKIPEPLRDLDQWVCWRQILNPKRLKPDKPPVDIHTGDGARSNDPKTWASFDECLKYMDDYEEIMGVGFETSIADPFTFLDLDDGRDPETGVIGDWAKNIIEKMKSYSEVSPSGTGIRIVIEAKLPPDHANRRGPIEIYSHSQYLTMTGKQVPVTPLEIRQASAELAELYETIFGKAQYRRIKKEIPFDPKLKRVQAIPDDELIAKASSAANGAKFLRLWTGDLKDANGDHSSADASLCSILSYWTRADAARIDKLFRKSKLIRPKWDNRHGSNTYGERTIQFAIGGCSALYDPDLDLQLAEGHNDVANTEVFLLLHPDEFLWHHESKFWLTWNCHHWEPFADLKLLRAAEDVSQELLRRAIGAPDPNPRTQEKRIKWATSSGDARRVSAIDQFSRRRANIHGDELDSDAYLLCCQNGVVDLTIGELRDGQRSDRCVRTTDIIFDQTAECPTWDNFLLEIMEGDEEMVYYLWKVLGYSLTGDTRERSFFLFHGEGRNGKSTFVETLKAAMGPSGLGYAQKARFSTFLKKHFAGGVNDDVAHLAGARVVIASEADEKIPMDVSLVKELTGGDTHRARFLYGREFEYVPQFKLFLVTNKIPPIHETTYAIWDRLHYVPFNFRVPDEKVDRDLRNKLLGELSGILTKAVRFCLAWQHEGLKPPLKVLQAGKKLQETSQPFDEFLTEMLDFKVDDEKFIIHNRLYETYKNWFKQSGKFGKPYTSQALVKEMMKKVAAGDCFRGQDYGHYPQWLGVKFKELPKSSEEPSGEEPPGFYQREEFNRQPGDN